MWDVGTDNKDGGWGWRWATHRLPAINEICAINLSEGSRSDRRGANVGEKRADVATERIGECGHRDRRIGLGRDRILQLPEVPRCLETYDVRPSRHRLPNLTEHWAQRTKLCPECSPAITCKLDTCCRQGDHREPRCHLEWLVIEAPINLDRIVQAGDAGIIDVAERRLSLHGHVHYGAPCQWPVR